MSTFVGILPLSNPLWVAIETKHFHIAHTIFFRTPFRLGPDEKKQKWLPGK